MGAKWHRMLSEALTIVEALPPHESGKAVLDRHGVPYRKGPETLNVDLQEHTIGFHEGRIGGVWPAFRDDRRLTSH